MTDKTASTSPLDLTARCALCPESDPPPPRKPRDSPGGWLKVIKTPQPPPYQRPPVSWTGRFRPSGLYADVRGVDYGLCDGHRSALLREGGAARVLEARLLKAASGQASVPLTPVSRD